MSGHGISVRIWMKGFSLGWSISGPTALEGHVLLKLLGTPNSRTWGTRERVREEEVIFEPFSSVLVSMSSPHACAVCTPVESALSAVSALCRTARDTDKNATHCVETRESHEAPCVDLPRPFARRRAWMRARL